MKLSEIKNALKEVNVVKFVLPSGEIVPSHFHVTEIGEITKKYIDCGGQLRNKKVINFQLWTADDFDHRLSVEKLQKIITLSETQLSLSDEEVEVEYQLDTIGTFDLEFDGISFLLKSKQTDCLAKDKCGVPQEKKRIKIGTVTSSVNTCEPGGGCC